jgi:hypothetical protein
MQMVASQLKDRDVMVGVSWSLGVLTAEGADAPNLEVEGAVNPCFWRRSVQRDVIGPS